MGHTLWLRFPGAVHLLGSNTCSNFSMQALKEILVVTSISVLYGEETCHLFVSLDLQYPEDCVHGRDDSCLTKGPAIKSPTLHPPLQMK